MSKARVFWPVLFALATSDLLTKTLAVRYLAPELMPHRVVGDVVRMTLTYNPGAALNMSLGDYSRAGFSALALATLVVLVAVYRRTPANAYGRGLALGLLVGGALGNLLDRLRSARGVVDFIDIGIGSARFWTFNLADVGVTTGAVLLAVLYLKAERVSLAEDERVTA